MKKLFFAAALAIVAVGGALTVKAGAIYEDAFGNTLICDDPITLIVCTGPLYEVGHGGDPDFLVDPAAYMNWYKQN